MSRLLIIGLDALDPLLVDKWRMTWFKQKAWGRHYVGLFKNIYTPIVWSTFLTGINVEKNGYDLEGLKDKRTKDSLRLHFLFRLYKLRKKIPIKNLGLRSLLIKLKLMNPYIPEIMPEELLSKTFLYELASEGYKAIGIEIPGFNEKRNAYYRKIIPKYLDKPFNERKRFLDIIFNDVKKRIELAQKYVDHGYDVVFVYSPLPDEAFHLAVKPSIRNIIWLRSVHYKLYKLMHPLLELANKNSYTILIVSDHGFNLREMDHGEYGFWSLNIIPPRWWNIRSILDFKANIVKLVKDTP